MLTSTSQEAGLTPKDLESIPEPGRDGRVSAVRPGPTGRGSDAVRQPTLEPRRRRRAPSQRETVPTTWTAVAQSSSAGSPRPWRPLPGLLYVMPTGTARPETTRPQRRNDRRPSVLAMPPDEHAPSPEQPQRRPGGEPKIIRRPQAAIEASGRAFADLLEPAEGRELRAPDDAAGQADCQVVEAAQPGPRGVLGADGRALSGFGGGWSEQPFVSCFGAFVGHQTSDRSRHGMWATVPRQCCRPIGRSFDGEPRDVAPAAGSDAPPAAGHPRHCLPAAGRRSERANPTDSDQLDP